MAGTKNDPTLDTTGDGLPPADGAVTSDATSGDINAGLAAPDASLGGGPAPSSDSGLPVPTAGATDAIPPSDVTVGDPLGNPPPVSGIDETTGARDLPGSQSPTTDAFAVQPPVEPAQSGDAASPSATNSQSDGTSDVAAQTMADASGGSAIIGEMPAVTQTQIDDARAKALAKSSPPVNPDEPAFNVNVDMSNPDAPTTRAAYALSLYLFRRKERLLQQRKIFLVNLFRRSLVSLSAINPSD